MRVTYISHSGFMIETEHYQLVFDYYQGELPKFKDKKVIFFVSHRHADHFVPEIYDHKQAFFVLSRDIYNLPETHFIRVKHRQEYEFEGLKIETLKSTDEGVAFLVECDGYLIYHAGDLNWWHWAAENKQDEFDNEVMKKRYFNEIERIKDRKIDIAFIVLDPRLEGACSWGMKAFLEKVDTQVVFPMHMWDKYDVIEKLKNTDLIEYKDKLVTIHCKNEVFEL